MGFKIRYRQSVTEGGTTVQDEKTIDTFDSVWDVSPLNSPWTNAGCYAGATPTNGSDIGAYSVATWSGWNKDSVYSDMRDMSIKPYAGSSQQNLRFMAKYNSGSYIVPRQYFNWTNLREPTVRVVSDAIESLSNYSEYDPYRRQEKNVSAGGTSNSPLNITPLVSLQINNLIFVPLFIIKEIEYYNYDDVSGGYLSVLNQSTGTLYNWGDIKPEDKTPAGEHYDADLFERGWKEIDPVNEGGRRFRFCCGAFLIPYYGKCSNSYNPTTDTYTAGTNPDDGKEYGDRQVFGSVASQTDEFPIIGNTTNLTRPCLMVMTESYNTVTGGLTYSTPTGIMFGNILQTSGNVSSNILALSPSWGLSSNFQTFVATTSWTSQFFTGNRDYSNIYADLDPSASNTSPDLSIPTKIDFDINISHLYDIADLSSVVHHYIPNDNPIAFLFTKSNRAITATNCAFFSINALWHTIASLGCYVADSTTTAQKAPTGYYTGNNNHLYLGHMDSSGITDGVMMQGGDIPSSVQAGIDDIINDTPYEPIVPTPSGGDDGDNINEDGNARTGNSIGARTAVASFAETLTTYYDMSVANASSLRNALGASATSFWEALGTAMDYSQYNLLNYIISMKYYPFQIAGSGANLVNAIQFGFDGNGSLEIANSSTYKLTSNLLFRDLGSLNVLSKNGRERTFLDFEPYTISKIFLPYLGVVQLPSIDVINANISVYAYIDVVTGMLTYYVDSRLNGVTKNCYVGTCKIGCDLSVSGNDILTQAEKTSSALISGSKTVITGLANRTGNLVESPARYKKLKAGEKAQNLSEISAIGSLVVPTLLDLASTCVNVASSRREVPSVVTQGSESGNLAYFNKPALIIERPSIVVPSSYGHEIGYPVNQTKTIRSLGRGNFFSCANPDLSGIEATEEEKAVIYEALTSGVIL